MAERQIGVETLNAYVDRELPPAEAARVARTAAMDPQIARQIATLHELRAGVAAMTPDSVVFTADRSAPPERRARAGLAAALAALVLTFGAGWWSAPERAAPPAATAPLALMVAEYDAWHEGDVAPVLPRDIASPRMTALMEETGLELVLEDRLEFADGSELRHAGFLGKRDCRISLFEMARDAAGSAHPAFALHAPANILQASWDSAETRHVLIARDMDRVRFATIAEALREATVSQDADDEALVAKLSSARQSCTG